MSKRLTLSFWLDEHTKLKHSNNLDFGSFCKAEVKNIGKEYHPDFWIFFSENGQIAFLWYTKLEYLQPGY